MQDRGAGHVIIVIRVTDFRYHTFAVGYYTIPGINAGCKTIMCGSNTDPLSKPLFATDFICLIRDGRWLHTGRTVGDDFARDPEFE